MAAFFGANEIWSTYAGDGREPVILVGVRELDAKEPVSEEEFEHSLSELAELAKACEMNPVDTVTQSLAHINTGLYVGAGKADEIRIGAEMFGAKAGLGFFVQYYADFAEYGRVLGGIRFMSTVVVLIMTVFDRIQRRVLHWTQKR